MRWFSEDRGVSPLHSGGGTGRQWRPKEYLLGGGLGLVIVGALVVTIWSLVPHSPGGVSAEQHFFCTKCNAEFPVDMKNLSPEQRAALLPGPMYRGGIDCPKCGAKNSAVLMVHCVNKDCGRWFVPSAAGGRLTCPYCKTDQAKYAEEHPNP